MAKIKKKTEKRIKRKVSKPKTRKKKGVFGVKKIKKNPLVAKSIFNSEASKVNALFIDNPKHGVQHNPHPDSDLNEALKEFDVLQNSQTENNSAPAEGKESLDLNNQNDINNINNQTQQPKENKKRFSWRKLFSFKGRFFSALIGLIFAGVFCSGVYVFANPPASPYIPPAPTNPGCSPGSTNCTVAPSLTDNFSANFSGTGDFITTGAGAFGSLSIGSLYTFPTADGTVGQYLKTNGDGTLSWDTVSGGVPYTGASSSVDLGSQTLITTGTISASGFQISGAAASGKILIGNGTSFIASTPTYPNSAGNTGSYLRADGTNWVASTLLLPNSATQYYIPVATATNTWGQDAGLTYNTSTDKLDITGYANISDQTNGYQIGNVRVLTNRGTNNILVGYNAGQGYNSFTDTVAVGYEAGRTASNSGYNTSVGSYAGYGNTGTYGVLIGYYAGYANSASYTSAVGAYAGYQNSSGQYNSYFGYYAGKSVTTNSYGTFVGYYSGYNVTGGYNTSVGSYAMYNHTSGVDNTAVGYYAGGSGNNSSSNNSYFGSLAGYVSYGGYNSFMGSRAGYNWSSGSYNTLSGAYAGGGGYNNNSYNTYYGAYAGNNWTGGYSTVIGAYAGGSGININGYATLVGNYAGYNTTGGYGVMIGYNAGYNWSSGYYNTLVGSYSGGSGYSSGGNNTQMGYYSGYSNTGSDNVYIGYYSGYYWGSGNYNTFLGSFAGGRKTTSSGYTTLIGHYAGYYSNGNYAVALGESAGYGYSSGYGGNANIDIGYQTSYFGYMGGYNVNMGYQAGYGSSLGKSGNYNLNFGYQANYYAYSGSDNISMGYQSMYGSSSGNTGTGNVAIGKQTLYGNYSTIGGSYNTAVGYQAGYSTNMSGSNVFLGYQAGYSETGSNKLYISNNNGSSTAALIYGEFNAMASSQVLAVNAGTVKFPNVGTTGSGANVYMDANGQIFKQTSSLRYKTDVQPLVEDWSKILQAQPKSFKFIDSGAEGTGYIAEEFDALGITDLVEYDDKGRPDNINYQKIPLWLLEVAKQQQVDINALKSRLGISVDNVQINQAGTVGSGSVLGVFDQSIQSALANMGVTLTSGVMALKQVLVDNLTAQTADISQINIQKMQIVDQANGEVYCTWIANGEWQKTKGECADVSIVTVQTVAATPVALASPTTEEIQVAAQAAQQAAQQAKNSADEANHSNNSAKQAADQAQQVVAEQAQTLAEPEVLNISSVAPISDINVEYGTELSSANLPTTVTATLSDDTTESATITWDGGTPAYDANTAGTYVFLGTLSFSSSITNTDNITASASVVVAEIVEEVPVEEEVIAPESTVGDLIDELTSTLLNGTWNFIKWIFGSSAEAVSSVPIIQKSGASLSQAFSWVSFDPITKLFGGK